MASNRLTLTLVFHVSNSVVAKTKAALTPVYADDFYNRRIRTRDGGRIWDWIGW